MSTSPSNPRAFLIETRYVWGKTVSEAMTYAMKMETYGWKIQGNPAPMSYNGEYGTGVSVSRIIND
jgi:hypothetical protein